MSEREKGGRGGGRKRRTSIEAYEALKESGKLSRLRWIIYDYLFHNGPATAQEAFKALGLQTNQSGRFTELRQLGVIEEVGRAQCRVTGREVIAWDVTERSEILAEQRADDSRNAELERVMREAISDLRRQNDIFAASVARRLERALRKES